MTKFRFAIVCASTMNVGLNRCMVDVDRQSGKICSKTVLHEYRFEALHGGETIFQFRGNTTNKTELCVSWGGSQKNQLCLLLDVSIRRSWLSSEQAPGVTTAWNLARAAPFEPLVKGLARLQEFQG